MTHGMLGESCHSKEDASLGSVVNPDVAGTLPSGLIQTLASRRPADRRCSFRRLSQPPESPQHLLQATPTICLLCLQLSYHYLRDWGQLMHGIT
jgi:hypothetical protein